MAATQTLTNKIINLFNTKKEMFDYTRTHDCGALRAEDAEKTVTLSGWVHRQRDHGGLIFVDLRDRFGLTQLVFDPDRDPELHATADKLRSEWVISVKGHVRPRAAGMANAKLATGDIEVVAFELEVLSQAKTPPFSICDEFIETNEELRLRYRYLDMRRGNIVNSLVMRHKAMQAVRKHLDAHAFVEVQTPILGKATPEGARDYLVPSRVHQGAFYALPQSPQIFKQLLMVGGLDRYYQIAACFRDEDLRAERQPEFTQIDIEMSFGTPKQLFPVVEGMVKEMFHSCLGADIAAPFREMSYQSCIERYGTDKPDLRFGMELVRIDDIAERSEFGVFRDQLAGGGAIKGLCVKGGADISRKGIDEYTRFVGRFGVKGLAWMKMSPEGLTSSIVKFFPDQLQGELIERFDVEEGDLLFFVADEEGRTNQSLDHLRRQLARDRDLIKSGHYEFLWVTDFPLFAWNAEEGRMESEHHPFTSPLAEDLHLMDSDPLKVRSSSYDLVVNGYEAASGSQRIHDSALQTKVVEVLQLSAEEIEEKFGFFVNALQYGTPPHLGVALGLDRLVMVLTETDHIRDVIAFPKTQRAGDLMMNCPADVTSEQLKELGITVKTDKPATC